MDLQEVRQEINTIDEQLVDLFVRRMKASAAVAAAKAEKNLPVLDKKREREVVRKAMERSGEDFETYTKSLYDTIFDLSKSYQSGILAQENQLTKEIQEKIGQTEQVFPSKAVVACQGIEGSYAEQACEKLFAYPNIMHFRNFESVFQAVESGLCQFGILPIENSSAGSVSAVYDLMMEHQFYIVRSTRLHINHALLVNPGTKFSDIQEIVSHEQAIQQCSNFLKDHDNIKVTSYANTAAAAKFVAESGRKDIAAIASPDCAALYGLIELEEGIQNNQNNYTRFICITKDMTFYGGANRISLMLTLPHRPGSLHEMLGKVSAHGLNLSKLESRPMPGKDFEFRFYFDLDGTVFRQDVVTLLKEMEASAESMTFLGCYSEE